MTQRPNKPTHQPRTLSERSWCWVKASGVSWPLLFGAAFMITWLGRASLTALADPDTYMHIAIGQWILAHGIVPDTDIFSQSFRGASWVAHEWLSDVLLYLIHQVAGWSGLLLVSVGIAAVTLSFVLRILLRQEVPPIYALLFGILAALTLATHLLARPHIFILPLMAVWFTLLIRASEMQRPPAWSLLLLMTLWANLHGSFVLGLALLLPLALEAVLARPITQRKAAAQNWALFVLLTVCASLITPYGLQGFSFVYALLSQQTLANIVEWRSADFSVLTGLEIWILLLLSLSSLGILRLPLIRLLIILGLLHEALAHVRYIAIFGLLTPLLIARPFSQQYRLYTANRSNQPSAIDRLFDQLIQPAKMKGIILCLGLVGVLSGFTLYRSPPTPPASITPEKAVDAALAAHLDQLPVLNEYGYGGYLIYRGLPVYIDGRADFYGAQYVQDYLDTVDPSHLEKFTKQLDAQHIDWTLLPANAPHIDYLNHQAAWEIFYADDIAVIHRRRAGK